MKILSKFIILIMLVTALGFGTASSAIINGILVDSKDTTELMQANVALLQATKDSTYVTSTVTDFNGVFNLENVQPGHYYLKCSYIGYDDVVKRVSIGDDGRDVNMGMISLSQNTVVLKETIVMGVKTPITVKEDTIEYNADTYKTQANAVVEDLLKRMPGVEVSADGKITANGKEVKKILVDGKEFFSDDPTMASKNIPADMINKLQVIDRKSDLARLTGVDDGEDETVINLTVKKGMNNGWFGTVTAGYGTDNRYVGNVIANYFNNGNQFTFTGNANNTNNVGFTDGGASRFRRFGGDRGITTSQMLGLNFNVGSQEDEHLRIGGDVTYSHTSRDTRTGTSRQNIFNDSTSYRDAFSMALDKTHNIRGNFRLKWEIDSCNTIDFRPYLSLNFSHSESSDTSMTRAGDAMRTPVNRSLSYYDNHGKSYEFGGRFIYNHKFKSHPGRSYSLFVNYNYSNIDEDGNTYTLNNYYLKDEEETIDQVYDNLRKTNRINGRLSWTEPLGDVKKAQFLTLSYSANYNVTKANKSVYDITRYGNEIMPVPQVTRNDIMMGIVLNPTMRAMINNTYGAYALQDGALLSEIIDVELGDELDRVFNENLSNDFRNQFFNQDFQIGYQKVTKAMNLNVGFSVNSAMSKSTDLINSARNIPARWAWSVAPFARIRYKFTKTRNLAFDYRLRSSQPSIAQLQPVADESNPLNIVIGNPDLKPTFNHRINLRFSDFNQDNQRSLMAMMNVNVQQNSIISTIINDPTTGGQTTTYTNINGVWDAMAMNMVSFPFSASKAWYFTSNIFARLSHDKGYTDNQLNSSTGFNLNIAPGLAYRTALFDLELRPRYGYQLTHNSMQTSRNRNVHTWGAMFNGTYSAPFGLVISTDLNFSTSTGYSAGYNTSQWIWNGSIAYQFLKNKEASVQISVYDILGQQKNISRTQTASYIQDAIYNSLGRYGMLTFTYRFSTFTKGQEPEDKNNQFRGPGGPPPGAGGRPPSGPPPGGFGGGRPPF
ncbi:MAG: outer membrane beta-barrel protein [Muribaculaceae bacterium]|nr:outer membrane beta-barrel protein [Muribaculaceae bacterium]